MALRTMRRYGPNTGCASRTHPIWMQCCGHANRRARSSPGDKFSSLPIRSRSGGDCGHRLGFSARFDAGREMARFRESLRIVTAVCRGIGRIQTQDPADAGVRIELVVWATAPAWSCELGNGRRAPLPTVVRWWAKARDRHGIIAHLARAPSPTLRSVAHFDVEPADPLGPAGAERLHHGLFGGPASGEMLV